MTNSLNSYSVGTKVLFGRSNGEQTLGEVIKVNRVKLKVRQLDTRGTYRTYPVGTVWTVPVSLCTPAEGVPEGPGVSKAARPEAEIKREILGIYCQLSPENLYCDGLVSHSEAKRRARVLKAKLQTCFTELGREVSEFEVYGLQNY